MATTGIELANAWVNIIPSTKDIAPAVKAALGDSENLAAKAGKNMGKRMSTLIGATLKAGAVTAAGSITGILGTSLTKGFGRLSKIESAKAALTGLGNSADDVTEIMKSANAAVKGTAFGLDEAASVAASAVASGIKPGEQLTDVLTTVGDTASIAGISMSDMGFVFNKVAAAGKLQGEEMNMVMDRGIPILQLLGDHYGKTADEVRKMVSDGKVSFEDFNAAMKEGMGGSAQKMGETFSGSLANVGAAMGRFGATMLDPVYQSAPKLFGQLGTVFDQMNEAIKPASAQIKDKLGPAFEQVGNILETTVAPHAADVAKYFGDLAVKAADIVVDPTTWERIGAVFGPIKDAAVKLWPALESLGQSFFTISSSISVAVWQSLADVLNALAPLVESVLVPLIERFADFAKNNPDTVKAIVVAFLGFKAVKGVVGPVSSVVKIFKELGGAWKFVSGAFKGSGTVANGILNVGKGFKSANPFIKGMSKGVGKFVRILAKVGKWVPRLVRFVNPVVAAITIVVGALVWFFTQTETGKRIWSDFVDHVKSGIDAVTGYFSNFKEKLSNAWDEIKAIWSGNGDNTNALAMLVGDGAADRISSFIDTARGVKDRLLEVRDSIVNGFNTAKDTVSSAWETVKNVFGQIAQTAVNIFGGVLAVVFGVALAAWHGLCAAWQFAYDNVIRPLIQGIAAGWQWLLDTIINPFCDWVAQKWNAMCAFVSDVWQSLKTTVIDGWNTSMTWLRDSVIGPIVDWIVDKWNYLKDCLATVWQVIKNNVIDGITRAFQWLRDNIFGPVIDFIINRWNDLRDVFAAVWGWIRDNVITPFNQGVELWRTIIGIAVAAVRSKWDELRTNMGNVWDWIKAYVFGKFHQALQKLQDFVSRVVDGIRTKWDQLKSALAVPVNFLINTVYNNGIAQAWDTIGTFLPLNPKTAKRLSPIGGYRVGGAVYGPGTATSDDIPALLSNGEHVFTAADVRGLGGQAAVYALRAAIKAGRGFTFDGSRFQLLPEHIRNSVGDLTGAAPSLVPAFKDGGAVPAMWELQLERAHEFARSQHGKPYQWAGPTGPGSSFDCSGFMGAIAATIQGTSPWRRYWSTGTFSGGNTAQGFVPGLGPGFSIGLFNGGPWGGHTAGTLGPVGAYSATNVESGGSPSMVKYGVGAAGADNGQFSQHYHLPIGADGAFVSGGAGGISPDAMRKIISDHVSKIIDKFMGPITSMFPTGGTEWENIPRHGYDKGKRALSDGTAEVVTNLGDKLSTVYHAVREIGSKISSAGRGVAQLAGRAIGLYDTGGVWESGTLGINLSGSNEYVFTNDAMRSFENATELLSIAGREISEAFNGNDWGYGALAEILGNTEWARAIVNGAEQLGKIADPNTLEGVAARSGVSQFGEIANMLGLSEVSTVVSTLIGAENDLLKARDGQAQRASDIADKEKTLAELRKKLADLESDDGKLSKAEARKLKDAEDNVAKARAETSKGGAASADAVAKAEEKLARVREDIGDKSKENEKKRAEDITKTNEQISKAEADLAEARKKSASALDMNVYDVFPQLHDGLLSLASLSAQASPALGGVTSGLEGLAAAVGPGGASIGFLIQGVKSIINVGKMVFDIVVKIINKVHEWRMEYLKSFTLLNGNAVEFAKTIQAQRDSVAKLRMDVLDSHRELVNAAFKLRLANAGVVSAQLSGAEKVLLKQTALDDYVKNQARIESARANSLTGKLNRFRGEHAATVDDLITGSVRVTGEQLALEAELRQSRIQARIEDATAERDQVKAALEFQKAVWASADAVQRFNDARKALDNMAKAEESFGLNQAQATALEQYTSLIKRATETRMHYEDITFKDSTLGRNTKQVLDSLLAEAESVRETYLKDVVSAADQSSLFAQLEPLIRAYDLNTIDSIKKGKLDEAMTQIDATFANTAKLALERATLDERIGKINSDKRDKENAVDRHPVESDYQKRIDDVDRQIKALELESSSEEYKAKFHRADNDTLKAFYARAAKRQAEGAALLGQPVQVDSAVSSTNIEFVFSKDKTAFTAEEMREVAEQLNTVEGLNSRVRVLEAEKRPDAFAVVGSRR